MGTLRYKKTILFVFAAASCLFAASCVEDIQQEKVERRVPVNLYAVSEPAISRAAINLQSDVFRKDQLINSYFTVTANNSSSSLISLKDGTLTSVDNPIVLKTAEASNGVNGLSPNDGSILYFPPGDNDKVNASIYALYPSTVTNIMTNFTVQTPQTSDDLYMLSDLMYASTSTAKTDQAIHLQFAHKMAKLVINATGEDNITMNKITLKKLYTTIDWTPSTGTLGSLSGEKTDIVIADQEVYASTLSGAALFPPQTKDDTYFAEVECKRIDGTTATAYFYIITKAFEEGKVYTVNMKIGIRNLNDDGIVTISPWPVTVGTINVEAVGNLGLAITSLADDGNNETNTMQGTGLSGYYTYNGKSCTPVPTVTDGKETGATTLTKGTDYEVSYYNNFNAGMALVVVTGKDGTEYEGLSTFTTYTIRKATNTMSYPNNNADYATNLSKDGIVQNMLVKPSNQTNEVYGQMTYKLYSDAALTTEYTDADPIATIDNNGNVYMKKKGGPIYVKATMDDTGNYEAKSVSYKLTITAGDVSQTITIEWNDGAAVGSETWPFTGLAVRPGFKIKDNGNTLAGSENSGGYDYNYTYGNNIQVGSGTSGPYVEITGQGEYAGTKRFYFSITKVDNSWATLNEPLVPIDCGATASSPRGGDITLALSLPAGTFEIGGRPKFGTGTNYTGTTGNVTYTSQNTSVCTVSSTGVITGKGVGTTTVTASVGGTSNYNALTKTISVTVEQMSYIFVYNGTTEISGSTYFQVRGGSAQSFKITSFTADATVYAAVVGAGGGSDQGGAARGGQGGLVVASKQFSKGTGLQWYIFCGGGGQTNGTGSDTEPQSLGGWPGGGRPGTSGSSGGGGGATAICTTNSTENWDYSANDSRMLVAGGGGGSSYSITQGGYAGGPKGTSAGDMSDYSGTARKKWMGGRAAVTNEVYVAENEVTADGGSGGAGYYGGRGGAEVSSANDTSQGGHGGSNYIRSDWTNIYSGYSGTENGSGTSSTYSPTTKGPFTIQYNGHKRNDATNGIGYNVWPGYVLIKYTY